jgi:hypothetical protein
MPSWKLHRLFWRHNTRSTLCSVHSVRPLSLSSGMRQYYTDRDGEKAEHIVHWLVLLPQNATKGRRGVDVGLDVIVIAGIPPVKNNVYQEVCAWRWPRSTPMTVLLSLSKRRRWKRGMQRGCQASADILRRMPRLSRCKGTRHLIPHHRRAGTIGVEPLACHNIGKIDANGLHSKAYRGICERGRRYIPETQDFRRTRAGNIHLTHASAHARA